MSPIEVWVDVGGTFTDCYLHQAGKELRRIKVLSSGAVPISVNSQNATNSTNSTNSIKSLELSGCPDQFWVGAKLRAFDVSSAHIATATVVGSRGGELHLDRPLPNTVTSATLDAGIEAPVLAVRRLLGLPLSAPLPPLRIRLGTTRGTNALLTRGGARTALLITSPFEDLLHIGDQTRPDLFALGIDKPPPLAERSLGIRERLDATGQVLRPLDVQHAREQLAELRSAGIESLAICLMHSYLNPSHEEMLARLATDIGFSQISRSSQLAPLIEIVARAQTTIVDAYLSPIIRQYLAKLIEQMGDANSVQLLVMTSAGGLVDWRNYSGKDCILSGPAGGVAALRGISKAMQYPRVIGLDMGGTSTDVCRVSADHDLQYESTKAGVRILTPTLPIETVAAGGGSVCWFDGVSLRVGPQSAGADPGPACYGRGGPLTITDLNVWLGRLPASQFPFPIDGDAIRTRLSDLQRASHEAIGIDDLDELAAGFRRIANAQMAEAVRTVSIAQGTDPRTHALLGFGGAAGQHICEIAEELGITDIIDTQEAGLLSALGMGLAELRLDTVLAVYTLCDSVDWSDLYEQSRMAAKQLAEQLQLNDRSGADIEFGFWLELRYANTDFTLTLAWGEASDHDTAHASECLHQLRGRFDAFHQQRYGYARSDRQVELVAVRIEAIAKSNYQLPNVKRIAHNSTSGKESLVNRADIAPGEQLLGPCTILNPGSTLVIEAGWRATAWSDGTLMLVKESDLAPEVGGLPMRTHDNVDPVFRDCFAQRLSAIATQMGVVLQQTALSVNVKQRRDYSCAVFDATGQLLANAPHVPVHLGAMGRTVREVIGRFPEIDQNDSFITNDPYCGGSHLPDVTVITPVFMLPDAECNDAAGPQLAFFVANRAHHADIGGVAPGSMSIAARQLGDEGVIIPPLRLTSAGGDRSDELVQLLRSSKYPPRNIRENMADIAAQQAANRRGVELLQEYAASTSWNVLALASEQLLDAAEQRVRSFVLTQFVHAPNQLARSELHSFVDHLDDGTAIGVEIDFVDDGGIRIDFSQSGATSSANFNANPSIVRAAVMYVLRCLIADDMPLNEGVMRCVELVIPEGVLNPRAAPVPEESPAVVAGNVETSQRVVDVLLGALGVAAASQGTMNNLLFGNHEFGFYETICGGSGAVESKAGASGVHTHMTNTRLTDPEVLEARYPVRLIAFRLRAGSGGDGRWRGGDGVVRCIEFLEPVELSLLTSRRGSYVPFGLHGGSAGQRGINTRIAADGSRHELGGCCQLQCGTGDCIEIQTPGGGGFGSAR